jgi:hypothetical protein
MVDLVGVEHDDLFHAMEAQWQPEIDSKAVSNRNIGQNPVYWRYFRPISGKTFQQVKTAELHGRGFSGAETSRVPFSGLEGQKGKAISSRVVLYV